METKLKIVFVNKEKENKEDFFYSYIKSIGYVKVKKIPQKIHYKLGFCVL